MYMSLPIVKIYDEEGYEVDSKLLKWINQPRARQLARDWKSQLEIKAQISHQLNLIVK